MARAFVVVKVSTAEALQAELERRLPDLHPRLVGSCRGSAWEGVYHSDIEADATGDELFRALARWFGADGHAAPFPEGALLWFKVR